MSKIYRGKTGIYRGKSGKHPIFTVEKREFTVEKVEDPLGKTGRYISNIYLIYIRWRGAKNLQDFFARSL